MCTFSTSERQKRLKNPDFFTLLTSKCSSRRNGLYFFDISTSKSGPNPSILDTFDLEMCFAPQRRTLFEYLNFQKCSEAEFWLRNVLCATTACTTLPQVLRIRQFFLTLMTWKCASRHNRVHFFDISTSKSAPKLKCFVHFHLEICFAPQCHKGVQFFHLSSGEMAPHPPL